MPSAAVDIVRVLLPLQSDEIVDLRAILQRISGRQGWHMPLDMD